MIDKPADIVFNDPVAADIFLMGIHAPEIVNGARPGQFVMIRVGSILDPLLRRPFSICGTRPDGIFLILYKVVGRGTLIMSEARKGDRLTILGPLGRGFVPPGVDERPLLVAGGLGIAPILFMAQSLAATAPRILTGFRCAAEMIPLEKCGVDAADVLTATDDGSCGHHGFVTDLLEEQVGPQRKGRTMIYACGPEPMLKKVAAYAAQAEVGCQVSLETYMACGLGACQGCAVKTANRETTAYHLVCREGPVFSTRSIDWNAR